VRREHQRCAASRFPCAAVGPLAGHLHYQQPDGQAGERGERAGGGGQPVGENDWLARFGLDVADVLRNADRQADQRSRPRPTRCRAGQSSR
jgi:hypothetical protein